MNFKINVTGLPQTQAKLSELADRMRDLSPLIQRISIMELASAQGRIEAGGPGWPATAEDSTGTPLNRTGALLRSLTRGSAGNLWQDIPGGVKVGTSLQTDSGYNIGAMMQYGTGVYSGHGPITPKNGKFLVFQLNGKTIFARSVQGSPPRPFLFISPDDAERAVQLAKKYVQGQT